MTAGLAFYDTTDRTGGGRPFFTTKHAPNAPQMLDHTTANLTGLPPVGGNSTMNLADVIGQQGVDEITAAQSITFHSLGDSGNGPNSAQAAVAEAKDYDRRGRPLPQVAATRMRLVGSE